MKKMKGVFPIPEREVIKNNLSSMNIRNVSTGNFKNSRCGEASKGRTRCQSKTSKLRSLLDKWTVGGITEVFIYKGMHLVY